ncbi:MAG: hypothetical protein M8354_10170 [Halalkalicoccus sp.]|nr:hypothetical protein [Halalkalicoccus sp.]
MSALLTFLIFLAPVFIAIAAYRRYFGTDQERIEELESEVEELRKRIEE